MKHLKLNVRAKIQNKLASWLRGEVGKSFLKKEKAKKQVRR